MYGDAESRSGAAKGNLARWSGHHQIKDSIVKYLSGSPNTLVTKSQSNHLAKAQNIVDSLDFVFGVVVDVDDGGFVSRAYFFDQGENELPV